MKNRWVSSALAAVVLACAASQSLGQAAPDANKVAQPPKVVKVAKAEPPAAVMAAIKAEWPELAILSLVQTPAKTWETYVVAKAGGKTETFFAAVTEAGIITKVKLIYPSGTKLEELPKAVADAVAAAVTVTEVARVTRVETRVDEKMVKLAQPAVTYRLSLWETRGRDELSVTEDGKDLKFLSRMGIIRLSPPAQAPAAVVTAVEQEWPESTIERFLRLPKSARRPENVWLVTVKPKQDERAQVFASVTETGVLTSIMYDSSAGLPKAIVDAVTAALPGGEIVRSGKMEARVDEKMAKLTEPVVTYNLSVWSPQETVQLSVSEDGTDVKSLPNIRIPMSQNPKAEVLAEAVKAIEQEWPEAAFEGIIPSPNAAVGTRAGDMPWLIMLKPKPDDQMHVIVSVTQSGIVAKVATNILPADLPKAVVEAAARAVPGGTIQRATEVELRADEKMANLPKPLFTFALIVAGPNGNVSFIVSEDGKDVKTLTSGRPTPPPPGAN